SRSLCSWLAASIFSCSLPTMFLMLSSRLSSSAFFCSSSRVRSAALFVELAEEDAGATSVWLGWQPRRRATVDRSRAKTQGKALTIRIGDLLGPDGSPVRCYEEDFRDSTKRSVPASLPWALIDQSRSRRPSGRKTKRPPWTWVSVAGFRFSPPVKTNSKVSGLVLSIRKRGWLPCLPMGQ